MNHLLRSWRFRLAVEVVTFTTTSALMVVLDAPAWGWVLLGYATTRASIIGIAGSFLDIASKPSRRDS